MKPPVLASTLLSWVAPAEWVEAMSGDLEEEFRTRGRLWYWRQALISGAPMACRRLSLMNWQLSLLAIVTCCAVQLAGLDLLWSLLLSQVPLKADVVRGNGYMLVSLAITVFSTSLAGRFVKVRGLLLAIPAVLVFTSLGLAAMRGVTPLWFGLATAGAAAFGLSAGALVWRRIT